MIGNCQCNKPSADHEVNACPNRARGRYLRGEHDFELCDACILRGDEPWMPSDASGFDLRGANP